MKKIISVLLLIPFWFVSCTAQNNSADTNRELNKIVEKYYDNLDFMGSVLVAQNGNILLSDGYGFADMEGKIANTPNTCFFLASVSKLFTVACIAELKNKGLLNYNSTLSEFIPDYPNGDKITIEHLIQHKSGIVDVVNETPYDFKTEFTSIPDLIGEFKKLPLNFPPGERYQYCTSGYVLLAYIIEKVSGMSYSDFIQTQIFDPLKMTSSYSVINTSPENQAIGYNKVDGKFLPGKKFSLSQFVGAGNLSSTAGDLYNWYNGLYKTQQISTDYQSTHYGGIAGCTRTAFLFHAHADYVIIILSNYSEALVEQLGYELTCALWKNIQNKNKFRINDLKKLAGFYDYGNDGVLSLTERNGSLYAQLSGQQELEIFPVAENELVWQVVDASVKFETENGKLYAIHSQNGELIKAPKIEPIKLPAAALCNITGNYDYGNDGILTVSEIDGRLWAKLSDQMEAELFPITETEFYWMAVNAKIKFESDVNGEIIKAIHFQDGLKTEAPKLK
jgi:CubicO group peptidase (beta-lactamase class C family)